MKLRPKPLVSVIIATKNEALTLPRLLRSLTSQTYPSVEVIMVDNHSPDQTVAIAREYTTKVFIANRERSHQRNVGAQKAQGEFLLFLDADMVLSPLVIEECVKLAVTSAVVGVIIPEDVEVTNFYSRIKRLEKRMYWNEPAIEAARFYLKSMFVKLRGYDETLVAGEDWDISQRAARFGSLARSRTPLFHNETSLFRELRHKFYYSRHMQNYADRHPQIYTRQRGTTRIGIFFRKMHLLIQDPLAGICLVAIKSVEMLLFVFVQSLTTFQKTVALRHYGST